MRNVENAFGDREKIVHDSHDPTHDPTSPKVQNPAIQQTLTHHHYCHYCFSQASWLAGQAEHSCSARARRTPETPPLTHAASGPARMCFIDIGEDIAAHAAGSPARTTNGPRPSTAYAHVRLALLNRNWAVGTGAAIIVGVVSSGICYVAIAVRSRARGVEYQPFVRSPDAGPCERVPIVVRDAALDGVAGRNPCLRGH